MQFDPLDIRDIQSLDEALALARAAQTLGFMWHLVANGPEGTLSFQLDYNPEPTS